MIGPFDDPLFPDYQINLIGIATHKYSGKQSLFFIYLPLIMMQLKVLTVSFLNLLFLCYTLPLMMQSSSSKKQIVVHGLQKQLSQTLLKSCLYIHRNDINLVLNGEIHFIFRLGSLLAITVVQKYSVLCQRRLIGFLSIAANFRSYFIS